LRIYQLDVTLKSVMRQIDYLGNASALTAMVALGGAFAMTPLLLDYPVYAGQALRYAAAAVILTVIAHRNGRGRLAVTRRELLGLTLLALTGLVSFNVALIEGLRYLDPATMGTVVGASPVVLATLGPLIERRLLSSRLIPAAVVVVIGSTLTYGAGPASGRGLIFAISALACESSFSLIAVPLLPRLGPIVLSAYVTGLAAVILALAASIVEPMRPFPLPSFIELLALAYLALIVTAFAFVAWYTGVSRLGAARAGLYVAILPVVSAFGAAALGTGTLTITQAIGTSLVALGLVCGGATPTSS
jgi:drug/metabolite transporter (DMT)-like permease